MKNLYEIKSEYLNLIEKIEESLLDENLESNNIEELNSQLLINENELKEKSLAYSQYIKSIEFDIDSIDKEIERLKKLKKSKESLINKLKLNLVNAFKTYNIDKLDVTTFKISLREAQSVNAKDWVEYWENNVKNVQSKIMDIILSDNQYLDCIDRVKKLFNIEIKVTANKKALKDEIINNDGYAFLSTLETTSNILIK